MTELANLNLAGKLAAEHGWDGHSIVTGDSSTIKMDLHRGDERLSLTAWKTDGRVHCLHGQLATGRVSSQQIRREWNSRILTPELTEIIANPARDTYANNSGFDLVVAEGEVQRTWETASNYTLHRTVAGRYPVELVNIGWQRTVDRPYHAIAKVPTIEVSRHYVNRVFTASSAHDEEVNKPSTIMWDVYAYQLPAEGESKQLGTLFTVVPAER